MEPDEVLVGDVILVKPGERIPLDGIVLEGSSTLDTSALTGESMPRETGAGAEVISGCINQTGTLRIRVSRPYGAKPLKQGHLRAKRGPLGPSRKSQQQTKRTGFAAHGHSIAETAPEGKRAKRANGALIRA